MPLLDDPWLPEPDGDGRIPAYRAAAPVGVFRFDGVSTLDALPNLECLSVAHREGTDPGHATFRYNLASGLSGAPTSIEEALGTGFAGALAVNAGDRLVVQARRPDGVAEVLFDGYAVGFGMSLDPDTEDVHIGAVGVAWRELDDVIGGAILRDADQPKKIEDTRTDVPAHFNPRGVPNCTPDGYMAGKQSSGGDFRYPTFLDPLVVRSPEVRTPWTLPKAVRYILYNANPDQTYVKNPSGDYLDGLLVSPDGGGDKPGPLVCPDTPITGRDWPTTVHALVTECGFAMNFGLATDDAGLPVTGLNLFRSQSGPVKPLYLAARGSAFDPTTHNFSGSSLHRDVGGVVNSWTVKGGLDRWEASFILAPGFPMTSSDASQANLKTFDRSADEYIAANRDMYRLYVFDETGEGHYAVGSATKLTDEPSLDGLFGKDKYAKRRRRALGELVSVDAGGKPFPPRLAISTDYAGDTPGLWDGTGTWQQVTSSSWRTLPDRLGVEVTEFNPNNWHVADAGAGTVVPGGVVRGVEAQATTAAGKNFTLRLTCAVEADLALTQTAEPRGGSPLPQTIRRVIDASDRYRVERIDYPSEFNPTSNQDRKKRDDRPAALAEAQAIRAGTEAGVLAGPVTIPRLTTYYKIGDRIGSIEGRGLGLRTDQGSGDPVYPVVVGVEYHLAGEQATVLELSDAGTNRKRYIRKGGRPLRDSRGRPRFNRRGG